MCRSIRSSLTASCTPLSTPASTLVPRCGLPLRLRYGLRSAYLIPPPATLLDGTADHTKAQVVVTVDRHEPVANRRTVVAGEVKPATAPVHPPRVATTGTASRPLGVTNLTSAAGSKRFHPFARTGHPARK